MSGFDALTTLPLKDSITVLMSGLSLLVSGASFLLSSYALWVAPTGAGWR